MGSTFFPSESAAEGRKCVKGLFASIDMDGNVRTWAGRWGLDVNKVKSTTVSLSNGEVFSFATTGLRSALYSWTVMDRVTARGLVDLYPAVKAVPRAKLP